VFDSSGGGGVSDSRGGGRVSDSGGSVGGDHDYLMIIMSSEWEGTVRGGGRLTKNCEK
jgi:hypothetical protein